MKKRSRISSQRIWEDLSKRGEIRGGNCICNIALGIERPDHKCIHNCIKSHGVVKSKSER